MEASPVMLEPIASLKVLVPDKYTGDIMGDLNKRRGRVLGMNPDHKGNTIVEADLPMSELYGYSTQLRSMTGGSGTYSYEFARYEQAPSDVQEMCIRDRYEMAGTKDTAYLIELTKEFYSCELEVTDEKTVSYTHLAWTVRMKNGLETA